MKLRDRTIARASPFRIARKIGVAVAGLSVVVIGVLLPIPGTGLVVIPLGVAILATEFLWAGALNRQIRKLLHRLRPTFL